MRLILAMNSDYLTVQNQNDLTTPDDTQPQIPRRVRSASLLPTLQRKTYNTTTLISFHNKELHRQARSATSVDISLLNFPV
ncbi:hypothetical protein EB796_017482 [Bugula neritina]|uniref:Uncharacterized protein n=1 Tax=Bugula neritina TaxID=10212 RepID=A0A7J7JD46_BUGNE|nr:hypothetical protein EB796_017482 [Bugula neritina]